MGKQFQGKCQGVKMRGFHSKKCKKYSAKPNESNASGSGKKQNCNTTEENESLIESPTKVVKYPTIFEMRGTASVNLESIISKIIETKSGAPQGSALRPDIYRL